MIYTRLNRTGEIESVKVHGGGDVAEVYGSINEENPIYYKTRTLTGMLPLSYKALGQPLTDYLISGNTLKDGTPTPEVPVDVVGCGVRMGNLLEITDNMKNSTKWKLSPVYGPQGERYFEVYDITNAIPRGIISANIFENFESGYVPVDLICAITPQNTDIVEQKYRILNNNGVTIPKTLDTTSWDNVYLCIGYGFGFDSESRKQQKIDELFNNWRIMITESSATPDHYEPYGYKIPLTVNGTEYPIYLGQVETTRRVKKLVLTGEEGVDQYGTWPNSYEITTQDADLPIVSSDTVYPGISDRYIITSRNTFHNMTPPIPDAGYIGFGGVAYRICMYDPRFGQPADVKSYLTAQYAAGTPVTVWYALADPETGIVNEPLMKIGDYADTITMEQAGVTIPTVSGNNILDMISPVKPSEVYIKGNIKAIT